MPIDLTKTATISPIVKYKPTFFDPQLIGTGGSIGMLNHHTNPAETYQYMSQLSPEQLSEQDDLFDSFVTNVISQNSQMVIEKSYKSDQNTQVKTKLLCLLPISNMEMEEQSLSEYWGSTIDTKISLTYNDLLNDKFGKWVPLNDGKLQVRLVPSRLMLRQQKSTLDQHWLHSVMILYNLQLLQATQAANFANYADHDLSVYLGENTLNEYFEFDQNELYNIENHLKKYPDPTLHDQLLFYNLYTIDPAMLVRKLTAQGNFLAKYRQALVNYIHDFSIYDSLCNLSESFQTNLTYFTEMSLKQNKTIRKIDLDILVDNIAQMQVPLDQYQQLYKLLQKKLKKEPTYFKSIVQSNLNFRFNQLLTKLEHEKNNLASIPKHDLLNSKLSLEQQSAVKSPGPLTLVEAGAGTGKSSVLLQRISYLLSGGIAPEDVLVLSFTNAAAEHIKQLYPKVKSMTINAMVNQIYEANYNNQAIVSVQLFINSLIIEYGAEPSDPYIADLLDAMRHLNSIAQNRSFNLIDAGFQKLTKLINKDPQKLIRICTALGQTTFDIQIAMCYCGIDQIIIPPDITAKHILVDEVQDNSTFDFMFLLKYIIFEKASFFIVGDASQTLYAFRNANPYALNVLRTSNLFSIYQLTINFRSKQEILTYANVLLNEIEANRFANIQLKANKLVQPTIVDFAQIVRVEPFKSNRRTLPDNLAKDAKLMRYINNCLAKNEKITFLAYSHATLNMVQNGINALFGNTPKNVFTDISSKRTNESVLFSDFWADLTHDDRVKYAKCPKANVLRTIQHDFIAAVPKRSSNYASTLWLEMIQKCQSEMMKAESAYLNNNISSQQFLTKITGIMVRFEINHNFRMQELHRQNNTPEVKQTKIAQSNFIFCTIHSAKGLEFDNVVLLIDHNRYHSMRSEADKRAVYVGLTRAKNSEYVLAADASDPDDSLLLKNYDQTITELTSSTQPAQPAVKVQN